MSEKQKRKTSCPMPAGDEDMRAIMMNECTGLMPTPADEEAERLAFSEIETLQTGETLSRE